MILNLRPEECKRESVKGDVLEARGQRCGRPGADHCLEVVRVVQGREMKLEQVQATTVSFEQIIFVLLEEYSSCRADNRLGLGWGERSEFGCSVQLC